MARQPQSTLHAVELGLEEVESFLGRPKYNRGSEFRGYRNGSLPEQTMATGMGSVAIRQPRVSDVPVQPYQDATYGCRPTL